jgi:deoxycytidine triphosphate deaminase
MKTHAGRSVLGTEAIKSRLSKQEIFQAGTWVDENIRAAAYDLRVAPDLMVIPEEGYPDGRRYGRGERPARPVILKPGDVAFVSTAERLCMPWDLAANLGIKFGFARNGVLVLTGLIVDPGFGLERTRFGRWTAKEDERLHFVLVNLGQREFVIQPGLDAIASLQFMHVEGPIKKKYVPSGTDIDREFFSDAVNPMGRFALFHRLNEIQQETKQRLERVDNRLEVIQSATDRVIVFGVYLFLVTLLVAATAAILSLFAADRVGDVVRHIGNAFPPQRRWPTAIVIAALVLAVGTTARGVLNVLTAFVQRRPRRRDHAHWD